MKQKQKSHIRPIVIVMIFMFITIGYAYLTSSLNINGAALLKNPTWDVHFENIQVKDGSVTGEQVIDEPEIDVNQTTVSFHVNLKVPGDFYEFTVDAVNAGTIDAMIDNYSDLELTASQQKYLETSITYEDGEEVLEHQQLLAGDTAVYKVRVAYKLDLEAEDLPSNPEQLDLEFSVEFVQRDEDVAVGRRAEKSLYNVLKKAADQGDFARKYTGAHQDSMDASLSTHDIYHWYADNATVADNIKDSMTNVIFAGHCWQMYRTTDTGGVRLLYNGLASENQCYDTRSNNGKNFGYSNYFFVTLNTGNYYYGTDYTYNTSTKKFSLAGDIIQRTWDGTNNSELWNKYTCKSTDINGTCDTLYYTVLNGTGTSGSGALYLSATTKANIFGDIPYAYSGSSPAGSGYINGNNDTVSVYAASNKFKGTISFSSSTKTLLNSRSCSDTSYYSTSINYDGSNYTLVNPVVGSSIESGNYSGYYSFCTNATSGTGVYYLVGKNGSSYYNVYLNSTKTSLSSFDVYLADSYSDNGGTYSLVNYTTVPITDWFTNYSNYTKKFTCDGGTSCSSLYYITSTTNRSYSYYSGFIVLGKGRSGLTLTTTIKVHYGDISKSPSSYSSYKYTCNTNSSTCTAAQLVYVSSYAYNQLVIYRNIRLASSVTWDGSKYVLNSPREIEFNAAGNYSSAHYFCGDSGLTECNGVYYLIYRTEESSSDYIVNVYFRDGISDITQTIPPMLDENSGIDSLVKIGNEAWYKKFLLPYSSYIEDSIYCNKRTILSYGAWAPNGSLNSIMTFTNSSSPDNTNLYCDRNIDRFSVSNSSAKLDYPIGLVTAPEFNIMNNGRIISYSGSYYWTMTPQYFTANSNQYHYVAVSQITGAGSLTSGRVDYVEKTGLRPVISLKPGVVYDSGVGSKGNPYIVNTD